MIASTQKFSTHISQETNDQIESYIKRNGVTKDFMIETALQHYLQALREIPDDIVIPARLLVSETSMEKIADQLESDKTASPELVALMALVDQGNTESA